MDNVSVRFHADGEDRIVEYLYRAEAKRYSCIIDPDFEIYGVTNPEIRIDKYEIDHYTPCGAVLYGGKFINLTNENYKQWASKSPEEAVKQLISRRRNQVSILETQLKRAKEELTLAENWIKKVESKGKNNQPILSD